MKTLLRFVPLLCLHGMLVACGGGGTDTGGTIPAQTYPVRATVSGLAGTGLALALNGGATVPVSGNGSITLSSGLADGTTYQVTVSTAPSNPAQTCTLSNASGQVHAAAATVSVSCVTTASATVVASLDPALPAATAAMIVQVVTAGGTGALGAALTKGPTNGFGETYLFAVDSNNSLVTAALTAASDSTLNADSTAVALIRLFSAELEQYATADQLISRIRGSSGFPGLVTALDQDLRAGVVPLSDAAVVQGLVTVLVSIETATVPAEASMRAKAALRWESDPDVTVISSPNTDVSLHHLANAGYIYLIDNMPIPWSISSSQSPVGSAPPVTLSPYQVIKPNNPLGGFGPKIKATNSPFNVTVRQDAASLQSVTNDFALGIFKVVTTGVTQAAGNNCKTEVVQPLLAAAVEGTNATNPVTFSDYLAHLGDELKLDTIKSIFEQCAPAALWPVVEKTYLDFVVERPTGAAALPVATLLSAVTLANEANFGDRYWNQPPYSVLVCMTQDYSIQSCLTSMTGSPSALVLAPGASADSTITGQGAKGPTALPGNLQVTANPSLGTVTFASGDLKVEVPSHAGPMALPPASPVQILDPGTGTMTSVNVTVAWPTLVPSATTFQTSGSQQTFTVALQGPNGGTIALPNNIVWGTTGPSSQVFLSTTEAATQTSHWVIPANATPTGSFDITATDPDGHEYLKAVITLESQSAVATCQPPQGATTCAVTIYTIPGDPLHSGAGSPVSTTETQTLIYNGSPISQLPQPVVLGATIFDNVNGPPLNTPACNPLVPGCPPLTYHTFQLCAVDGNWTPASYHSLVSTQAPTPTNCTGTDRHVDIITGFDLSTEGGLVMTEETKGSKSLSCVVTSVGNSQYNTSFTGNDDQVNTASFELKDGSGSASLVGSSNEASTNSASAASDFTQTTTASASVSWPAEVSLPPQFANTGIAASSSQIPAGQALPQACVVGTP